MNKEKEYFEGVSEYDKICDCYEIQKHKRDDWKLRDMYIEDYCMHRIGIPNSDQLIEILGDNGRNILLDITKGEGCGISVCNKFGKLIFATTEDDYKTALAKAVLAVEGGKDER